MIQLLAIFSMTLGHAIGPQDGDYTSQCTYTCTTGGFSVEVLKHKDHNGSMLRFWPINIVEYRDDAHKGPGDYLLGVQTPSSTIAGGPYCATYPGAGGNYILGRVWERLNHSPWSYGQTVPLLDDVSWGCTASLSHLLGVLDTYTYNPNQVYPSYCWTPDCSGPSFGGGEDEPIIGSQDILDMIEEAEDFWNPEPPVGGGQGHGGPHREEEAVTEAELLDNSQGVVRPDRRRRE